TQQRILFRESIIALVIALFFQFFGEKFISLLGASDYTLTLTGGVLLVIVSVMMMFPKSQELDTSAPLKQEPYIVPIATPLITGPGLMTFIMVNSKLADSSFEISISILLTFLCVVLIMTMSPYLPKYLNPRIMDAFEKVMGLVLALLGIEMLIRGILMFKETLIN
ncbi:MAG: MarC family protein, partial [Chlamydiia bacterium]|nr:MarC family protein [Chlamydiia bacterium]